MKKNKLKKSSKLIFSEINSLQKIHTPIHDIEMMYSLTQWDRNHKLEKIINR